MALECDKPLRLVGASSLSRPFVTTTTTLERVALAMIITFAGFTLHLAPPQLAVAGILDLSPVTAALRLAAIAACPADALDR